MYSLNCIKIGTAIDPACGGGSLLIRALAEVPFEISGYGQEKESSTAGLAKMNAVLHNKATIKIMAGNTFSDPQFIRKDDSSELERFDYIVANPPFSLKNWSDGLKEFGRFSGYGDRPPEKNGDYAWLMHILKTLKSTGKAAVILPHGVLFRGNAEGTIRQVIVDKGWIKGIVSLPPNLFYGTGIPACILIIDKEGAENRSGIFMIDAGKGFVKDGNKNRLREQDIYRIITTFNEQITDDPKYARFVPNKEIKEKNGYNLNISRYIDSSDPEDIQDIYAHIHGGRITFTIDAETIITEQQCKLDDIEYIDIIDDKTRVRVTVYAFDEDEIDNEEDAKKTIIPFQLAYAVSIHKAQGLEYDSVKIVIPSVNTEKITRGVFYTAITRTKKKLTIYWSSETMEEIVSSFSSELNGFKSLEIIKNKLAQSPSLS